MLKFTPRTSKIQEKRPNHLMTRSLFYSKQAQPSTGRKGWDGAACCLADWKKRPSHPTLFAKIFAKGKCVQNALLDDTRKPFYYGPDQWIRILLGKWFGSGIRIADMSPIKKKIMNCSCFKDLIFLWLFLETGNTSRRSKKKFRAFFTVCFSYNYFQILIARNLGLDLVLQ
jgi:hypothetical protein